MNKWEYACKEWLRGCSCAGKDKQGECEECTTAFHNQLRKLAVETGFGDVNEHCVALNTENSGQFDKNNPALILADLSDGDVCSGKIRRMADYCDAKAKYTREAQK